jgi:isopenicillin-N epimerase
MIHEPINTPFGHAMLEHWSLEPDILYLNHGTVGVTPNRVMRAQQALRDQIERQPARFMLRELEHHTKDVPLQKSRLRVAADAVASFLGVQGDDLVFVDNATTGINAVLRSLALESNDEILITDLTYGAVAKTAQFVARERGARVVIIEPPFPQTSPEQVIEAITSAITSKTKILVLDHITAPAALVLPVREIAALCRARGVPVLVDGAHVPGALELDIAALGVDWYVGNMHKWAFAPRGCGVLWAAQHRQNGLHPTVISWGLDQGFTQEFDLVGTKDPTSYLTAPDGIAFIRDLGEDAMRQHNHDLAWRGAHALADHLGTKLTVPREMTGCLVSVPLPISAGSSFDEAFSLQHALLYQDRIEIPILEIRGRLYARISAQVYNDISDIERLANAIKARQ